MSLFRHNRGELLPSSCQIASETFYLSETLQVFPVGRLMARPVMKSKSLSIRIQIFYSMDDLIWRGKFLVVKRYLTSVRKMYSHVAYTLTLEFDQLDSCQRRRALTDVLAETGTGLGLGGAVI